MGCCESSERGRGQRTRMAHQEVIDNETTDDYTVMAIATVAGIALLAYLFSSSSTERKTMKAPGRNYRIFRDDFEDDPATYFRNLRD